MGMALVVIVLILFLGNWRGALLVSITIPASLLIAFILMHLTDIPANLLSLGAIDFGIIVDGAIVMLETILKKREDNPKQYLEEKSMAQRAKEVGRPILFLNHCHYYSLLAIIRLSNVWNVNCLLLWHLR